MILKKVRIKLIIDQTLLKKIVKKKKEIIYVSAL
jgi:hypothetical protein